MITDPRGAAGQVQCTYTPNTHTCTHARTWRTQGRGAAWGRRSHSPQCRDPHSHPSSAAGGPRPPSSEHPVLVCPRHHPYRREEGPSTWGGSGSGQQLSSPRGDGHPLFLRRVLVKGNLYCSEPGGPNLCSSLKPRDEKLKQQRRFRGFPLEKQEA